MTDRVLGLGLPFLIPKPVSRDKLDTLRIPERCSTLRFIGRWK